MALRMASTSLWFMVRVAKTVDGACKLIEAVFKYVTGMNDIKLFRKRK